MTNILTSGKDKLNNETIMYGADSERQLNSSKSVLKAWNNITS